MLTQIDFTEKLVFESNMWIIWQHCVEISGFSVIQILREINFGESRGSKTVLGLCNIRGCEICWLVNLRLSKNYKNSYKEL